MSTSARLQHTMEMVKMHPTVNSSASALTSWAWDGSPATERPSQRTMLPRILEPKTKVKRPEPRLGIRGHGRDGVALGP